MNSLGMTPLVPIFRANLPEEWILFLDIHLDGDTAHDLLSNVECRNCPGDDKPQGQSCGVYPRALLSGRETRRKKLDTEQSVGTPSSSLEVAIPRANRPISDVWNPSGRKTSGFRERCSSLDVAHRVARTQKMVRRTYSNHW